MSSPARDPARSAGPYTQSLDNDPPDIARIQARRQVGFPAVRQGPLLEPVVVSDCGSPSWQSNSGFRIRRGDTTRSAGELIDGGPLGNRRSTARLLAALLVWVDLVVRPAQIDDAAQVARVHVVAWQVAYRELLPQE